jgi:hypothetical protein
MEQHRTLTDADGRTPALRLTGLHKRFGETTAVDHYSTGMRKKITLATALLHTPRLQYRWRPASSWSAWRPSGGPGASGAAPGGWRRR